jgi:hypothetical protein
MANYRYYLGPWILRRDPAPDTWTAPDGCAGWLDLATLPELETEGTERRLLICWTAGELDSAYTLLGQGDCREIATTAKMRDAWESQTGYRPNGDTLVDLIWDQFTAGADPDGLDAVRPLMPTREGNLELIMPGHSVVRRERFVYGVHKHTNRVKAVIGGGLKEIRALAHASKCFHKNCTVDADAHRRQLWVWARQFGVDWSEIVPNGWSKDDTPKVKGTTLTDSFDRTNADALGTSSGGWSWTETNGDWDIASNAATCPETGIGAWARADYDLAANHYAQFTITAQEDGANNHQIGPQCRYASDSSNGYFVRIMRYYSPDRWQLTASGSSLNTVNRDVSIPYTAKIDANGSTITTYDGATQVNQVTNTTYPTQTRTGMYAYKGGGGNPTADDFEASDGLSASAAPQAMHYYRMMRAN